MDGGKGKGSPQAMGLLSSREATHRGLRITLVRRIAVSTYTRKDGGAVSAEQQVTRAAEIALGTVAATTPAWFGLLHNLNAVFVLITTIGGCVLVWWRVYLAIQEWREKRDAKREEAVRHEA